MHIADAARRALEDMIEEMGDRLEAMSEGNPERDPLAERIEQLGAALAANMPDIDLSGYPVFWNYYERRSIMSKMPKCPHDCVDHIPLTQLHRDLIIARIDYLITQRVHDAVIAAIEQAHEAAMRALVAPITAAEVDKAS